jgi:hypothetical protein
VSGEEKAREAIHAVVQSQTEQYKMVMGKEPPEKVKRQMTEAARKAAERAVERKSGHFLWNGRRP